MIEAMIQRGRYYTSAGHQSHFTFEELMCRCCTTTLVDQELIDALEGLRTRLDVPVKILSGYRCPTYNLEIGGRAFSRHLKGQAADVEIPGKTIFEVALTAVRMFPRVIIYPRRFVHVDVDHSMGSGLLWVSFANKEEPLYSYLAERDAGLAVNQLLGDFA